MNSFYKNKNNHNNPYNPSGDPSGGAIPNEAAFPAELVSPRRPKAEDEPNPPPRRARTGGAHPLRPPPAGIEG